MATRLTKRQGNIEWTHSTNHYLTITCLACSASIGITAVEIEDVDSRAQSEAAHHICPKIKRD